MKLIQPQNNYQNPKTFSIHFELLLGNTINLFNFGKFTLKIINAHSFDCYPVKIVHIQIDILCVRSEHSNE